MSKKYENIKKAVDEKDFRNYGFVCGAGMISEQDENRK